MARTVSLLLSAQHGADLQGVIEDRGRSVKHVQRAQIILLSAERLPVLGIAKRVGVSRPMVWRWQQRFAEEGIEGLLRDKTRPPGIPPVPQAKVHAVVERTLREPPGAVTHWTGRVHGLSHPPRVDPNFCNRRYISMGKLTFFFWTTRE
jgi:Homeodomain-like domain